MSDPINRQDATEAVLKVKRNMKIGDITHYAFFVIDAIENLPSAEPKMIHCKDCKYWDERTPVCNKTKKFGYGVNDYCSKAQLRV